MKRIGHRGACGHAPENTLLSIEEGIRLGSNFVELDVQRSVDGKLVLMHDKRVDRTTNGVGELAGMTLEQLRRLDAGGGESIPTLQEVIACANGRVGLILEIITPGIGEQLSREVREAGFTGPIVFASFLHAELATVDGGARMVLFEGVPVTGPAIAIDAHATHVGVSMDSLTPAFLDLLHVAGLEVFVYTVNDTRDIALLESWGVDGIISDHPERVPMR